MFSALSRRLWLAFVCLLLSTTSALAAPFVSGFSPNSGPPGTQVTLLGSGFRPNAAAPIVQFGTAIATLISASQTRIVAVVPDAATTGPVTVTVPGGGGQHTTTAYYFLPPRIQDFGIKILGDIGGNLVFEKPVVFTPGAALTIVGANFFVPNFPFLLVKVGPIPVSARVAAETQIQATLPALLETGFVSVHTQVGGVTNTTDYLYGPPRISKFTPKAAAGDSIEIVGVNFMVKSANQIDVKLGGVTATQVEVKSNTNLIAVVPSNALSGRVTVSVPGGTFITTTNFTVLPTIASFTPNTGPAGTVVTINGSGLSGTTQVKFGSTSATLFINMSQLQVTAVVPGSPLTGPITLVTTSGTNTSVVLFYGAPRVDNFTPSSGGPGTTITLNGVNFTGATQVQLNGAPVPNFAVVNNQQITLAVPADGTSGKLKVIAPGGTNESAASFLVRGPEPAISSFSPESGGPGTTVLIRGFNLQTATNVSFNGLAALFTVVQQTNLQATVPVSATTGPIRVATPNGVSESINDFTIGTTADVRIIFAGNPNPAVAFGPLVYNIQAFNNGPLVAQNTVIEFNIPPGLALIEVTGPFEPEINGQKLTYNRGSLSPGSVFLAGVRVNAGTPTNAVAFGRILTSTADSNPDNNSRFATNQVTLPQLQIESVEALEVLLSWPSAAGSIYQLKSAPQLNAPFTPMAGQPVDDGARLLMPLSATNALRLFRLELLGQ